MDVIVRHEMCERAKPGDICVFTGTVMAIPDVAQILMSGRHLNLQKSLKEMGRKRDGAGGQGVTGLKQLGCRELAYRLVFICSTVQTAADKVEWNYT
jgi:DNA replication licensing factor MCM6